MKKEVNQNPHPFRVIFLKQKYLEKFSIFIKEEKSKIGTLELLKTFMKEIEKNKILYDQFLKFVNEKEEKEGEIGESKLCLFAFSLIHPHKKITEIEEKEVRKGIMHNKDLIDNNIFKTIIENIENNSFILGLDKSQKKLKNELIKDLENTNLFPASNSFIKDVKNDKYTKLLNFINIQIPKSRNGKKNYYKFIKDIINDLIQIPKDKEDVKDDIEEIKAVCKKAKSLGADLTSIMDKCRAKLKPYILNQDSYINEEGKIIKT